MSYNVFMYHAIYYTNKIADFKYILCITISKDIYLDIISRGKLSRAIELLISATWLFIIQGPGKMGKVKNR